MYNEIPKLSKPKHSFYNSLKKGFSAIFDRQKEMKIKHVITAHISLSSEGKEFGFAIRNLIFQYFPG